MPYFLVTHTSLVEAKDEVEAAEKAYEKIGDSEKLTFDVKADEYNARQVVICARGGGQESLPDKPDASDKSPVSAKVTPSQDQYAQIGAGVHVLQPNARSRSSGVIYCAMAGAVAVFFIITHFIM